ncbi:Lar family restriction alleviation protein [Mesorhizobium sp. M0050]|uniref:Lar family restriction alleviation protein n=1 Tax=Mesorhizobium sp. M0050 TaxID=2956861 RepID=UPI003336951B
MSEAEELRSCPFCGSAKKPTVMDFEGEPYVPGFEVRCDASGWEGMDERGCGATSGWGETREEATANWNRRAPLSDTEKTG